MSMYTILFYTLTRKKGNALVEGKTRNAVDWGNSKFRIQWHCSLDTTRCRFQHQGQSPEDKVVINACWAWLTLVT